MTTFYGQVKGQGKAVGRCGSKDSHISASVQSRKGSLTSELYYDEEGRLCVQVYHYDNTSSMFGSTVYRGTVERFVDMCKEEMRRSA